VKVWVTGAKGMLGQEVVSQLEERKASGVEILATDREVDIADRSAVDTFVSRLVLVDWIVNCAAWTAVDAAEDHESEARRLNVEGPRVLAESASRHNAALLHISTDYVFAGEENQPYQPDDPTDPRSIYGITKRDGEDAVRATLARHVIVRTAWLYGPGGKNFVSTMLRLMNERDEIGVVADQYGLPTYAPDLASAIVTITGHAEGEGHWGTYHYTNAANETEDFRGITWFDFAREIYRTGRETGAIMSECEIRPLTTAEYPTAGVRPAYSVLDYSKTLTTFETKIPNWKDALQRYFAQISSKHKGSV